MPDRTVSIHMPTFVLMIGVVLIFGATLADARGGIDAGTVRDIGVGINQLVIIYTLLRILRRFFPPAGGPTP